MVEYEENHVTKRKYVVLKVPTSSAMHSFCESLSVYDKEISMYEKVIPQMNKYLDKSLAPAHLYTSDSKILVLEDLTARGYKSGEKFPLLNFVEAKGAMKTFAHYHSASHKLFEEVPHIFENFLHSPFEEVDFMKFIDPWGPVVLELLRRKNEHQLLPKIEAAFSYFEKHKFKVSTILDKSKFKFIALNHGDSRKDNSLFKYTTNNEVQVQFVDYQTCFLASPAYDLIVFLHGSVSADVLKAHFDELVDGYLHELNARLKKLECSGTYEKADFDEDFKSLKLFSVFGFFAMCFCVSPMNRQQIEDLFAQSMADSTDIHVYDTCLNDEQFVRPVYGWLKYFEKSKILDEF